MTPAQFYEKIASAIVEYPDRLKVSGRSDNSVVVFADDADYGKLIGMGGKNFRACEDLLQAFAMTRNLPFVKLMINSHDASRAMFPSRYTPDEKWDEFKDAKLELFIEKILTPVINSVPRIETKKQLGFPGSHLVITTGNGVHERIRDAISVIAVAVGRNRGRRVKIEFKP